MVIAYLEDYNIMYLQKDCALKPLYLAKHLHTTVKTYYGFNNGDVELPDEYRGMMLKNLNTKNKIVLFFKLLSIIIRKSKDIDCLFSFHLSYHYILLSLLLKMLNSNSKTWLAADMEPKQAFNMAEHQFVYSSKMLGYVKKKLINIFFRNLNVFSHDIYDSYNAFVKLFKQNGWNCLLYTPLSFDEDSCCVSDMGEKQNIILYVGRIGAYQKNSEMFLDALPNINLQNWQVYFVGPITDDFTIGGYSKFNVTIKDFLRENLEISNNIHFTGLVTDQKKLYSYFKKAKIFVMTSRHEGGANVYAQARWFGCHIVSTIVGCAKEITNNWKFGTPIKQEDPLDLANKINNLIAQDNITIPSFNDRMQISYNVTLRDIVIPKMMNIK